ncbi:MAG TPA: FlgD immunoglobulin-like domain containing protein, partial [Spirochaetia bacterium]|nr:FlgD immunoglobulin-like domain containing protein [Spirochaetia bacterium]
AGAYTVNAAVSGLFDLTLSGGGTKTFNAAVGLIGDNTGASLIQAGAGTVEFASTVTTAQGITQSGTGTITYRDNVTVNGSGTPSAYQNSVVLDGLVYASAGATIFGSDASDALTLSTSDVTLGGAGSYTVNAAVSGLFDLTLSGGGTKTFNAAVGLIGDNTGASLIQAGAGTVEFASTVTTAQGITQTGAGTITYRADVTVNGSATPSDYQNSVVLDGLVYASAGATTFGSDGTDALTLSGSMVSLAGAGAYIINASVGSNQHLVVRSTGNITFNATVTLTAVDIYVDAAIATPTAITLNGDLSCRNFYYFRGNLEIANGVTLSTTRDFVAFGGTYSANDPDYDGADTRFAYWASTALAYVPGGGTAPVGVLAPSAFGAAFEDLGGAIITVDSDSNNVGNFYVNGANMTALAAWTLNLPAGTASGPAYNAAAAVTAGQWGLPYAVAFNMTVSNSVAAGRSVAAAAASAGAPDGGTHHDVGGTSVGWNTDAPRIISVETVYDDVLRLTFDQAIENSNGEIDTLIVNALTNAGATAFAGAYTDPECTISTDTVDDIGTFYIQTSLTSWNTDATGTSPGAALSTDRDGNPRTTVPDLTMPLGLLRAAAGKAFVRNYGNTVAANTQPYDGLAGVGTFADECRPVLVSVEIGQDAIDHPASPDLQDEWNGRNYIQLRYSEPVVIGGLAVDAANVASMASFGAGEWGGALSGDRLEGYADFGGWNVTIAARTDSASGLDAAATPETVNGMYRDAPNAYGEHGLYVSVAGWSFLANAIRFWPGYFPSSPTAPAGAVTALGNANIVDAAGNPLEPTVAEGYAKAVISVIQDSVDVDSDAGTADVVGWDVTPPAVAEALIGAGTGYFDVVPLASGSEIDSFELQFTEFMRDSSFYYANAIDGGMAAGIPGWSFRDADAETVFRYGATALDTQVISTAFTGAAVDVVDDGLLRMDPVFPINPVWTARSQLLFQYAQASALVTDAAGNLLPSYAPSLCAEKLPPKVRFVSAEVGSSRIYLQFTEPVWHDGTRAFVAADFSLSGTATSVSGVQLITPSGPVSELWLDLTEPVTTAFALDARIALGALVMDRGSNYADPSVLRRAVDVAVGPVTVLGASDGVHVGDQTTAEGALAAGALGLLRTFDGSGRLYDMDTTIFTSLDLSGSVSSSTALSMYYDVAPSDDYASTIGVTGRLDSLGPFWLPVYLSGFNLEADGEARLVSPFTTSADGLSRNFLVPASDPEVASGAEVGFLFRMGNLWIARNSTPGDPRQFDLWRYKVQDIVKQRGGVTILNNVIDSTSGERAAVQVDLARGGQVTVLVFTLDGDVVRSLHRGRLAAGSYTMTWDGTNAGGNPVARGIYFVRVVGPDIDEIRKVMVVKN